MTRSSTGFKKDTVVQVVTNTSGEFVGVVAKAEAQGFWIQDFDDNYELRCRWVTRQHNEITEIRGYHGVAGLAIYISERFLRGYIWVWEHLPQKFALERMISHAIKACNEWRYIKKHPRREQSYIFQIQNCEDVGDEQILTDAIVEVYDLLAKDRPKDFDPKHLEDDSLEDYFDLSHDEALACFQKHPTMAMARVLWNQLRRGDASDKLHCKNTLRILYELIRTGSYELEYAGCVVRSYVHLLGGGDRLMGKSNRELAERVQRGEEILPETEGS